MIKSLSRYFTGKYSRHEKILRQFDGLVQKINTLEPEYTLLSDNQLRQKTQEFKERHKRGESLDSLLPEADFVIVAMPHTPETEGLWNAQRFARMKPTAYFINIGRGMTTKLDDLVAALEAGTIAGCGLDVFEVEPLPPEHKLWRLPNVLLTPHIAVKDAVNIEERQFQILLDNVRRFAAGEPLRNVVNKGLWY